MSIEDSGAYVVADILRQLVMSKAKKFKRLGMRDLIGGFGVLAGEVGLAVQSLNQTSLERHDLEALIPQLRDVHVELVDLLDMVQRRWSFGLIVVLGASAIASYRESVERLESLIETWEICAEGSIYAVLRERLGECDLA
jgi:hypothetical protein